MRLFATLIVVTSMVAPPYAQAPAPDDAPEVVRLVATLEPKSDRRVAWSATARLQKLGAPAVTALVDALRRDTHRDIHGNHSPIMEALEKIGPPAARALDAALTPATLKSASAEDLNFVTRAANVLARIGVGDTARTLVRIARSTTDGTVRDAAATALVGQWRPTRNALVWIADSCLGRHWSECPYDPDAPRVAAAVAPLLGELGDMLAGEPPLRTRFAIAPVLARWGDGAVRRRGEQELVALASSGEPYYAAQAIEFLGVFGVEAAAPAIRARAAAPGNDALRRTAAEALERLQDPAYIPMVISLLTSQDRLTRQWSMESARRSQSVAFVPALIDRLGDPFQDGRTRMVIGGDGRASSVPVTASDDALSALRALTFQDLGTDQAAWRAWWSANQGVPWSTHLTRFIDGIMAQIIRAEPWTLNAWMTQLEDARHPAVLPFLAAYLRHPRTDPGAVSATRFRGGGGPPIVFRILTQLVARGSSEARQLLYECQDIGTWPFIIECPKHVAAFAPERARERLAALMAPLQQLAFLRRNHSPESIEAIRFQAAEPLLELGDARAIPVLIELVGSERGVLASAANRLLRLYTQEDIVLDSDAAPEARRQAHEAWQSWWQSARATFIVNVRAARIDIECCRI